MLPALFRTRTQTGLVEPSAAAVACHLTVVHRWQFLRSVAWTLQPVALLVQILVLSSPCAASAPPMLAETAQTHVFAAQKRQLAPSAAQKLPAAAQGPQR